MGFGDEGIVALSGAHTLGRAFKVCLCLCSRTTGCRLVPPHYAWKHYHDLCANFCCTLLLLNVEVEARSGCWCLAGERAELVSWLFTSTNVDQRCVESRGGGVGFLLSNDSRLYADVSTPANMFIQYHTFCNQPYALVPPHHTLTLFHSSRFFSVPQFIRNSCISPTPSKKIYTFPPLIRHP